MNKASGPPAAEFMNLLPVLCFSLVSTYSQNSRGMLGGYLPSIVSLVNTKVFLLGMKSRPDSGKLMAEKDR